MFPLGPPSPLGFPVRREDWYYIGDLFVSATVVVYPGELVGVSERVYTQLTGMDLRGGGQDHPDDMIVVHYPQMVILLEKNGFNKF
jgi:hypothetical protein